MQGARLHLSAVGSSDFCHAAKIPASIIENYVALDGEAAKTFRRAAVLATDGFAGRRHWQVLNDPGLSGFRVWKGRV